MIGAGALFVRTRFAVRDTEKARYSDYEVGIAVNAAVDLLCEGLKKYFSRELVRSFNLDLKDWRCKLPGDFLYVVGVWDKNDEACFFLIEGDEIYTEEGAVLDYGKHPGRIESAKDEIDLSPCFLVHLAAVAASLLRGDENAAREKAFAAARENNADKSAPLNDPVMWGG